MEQDQTPDASGRTLTREAFLARFDRAASGLDPDQVFALFSRVMARVEQVERRAKRASAPFVMEVTLREAAELCARASEATERAYAEVVRAAEQEAGRRLADAREQSAEIVRAAENEAAAIRARAEEQARARVEQATREAAELRRSAVEAAETAQSMLDEARRITDRTPESPRRDPWVDERSVHPPASPTAPVIGPGDAWPRAEPGGPQPIPSRRAADPTDDLPTGDPPLPPERASSPAAHPAAGEEARRGSQGPFKLPDWLDV